MTEICIYQLPDAGTLTGAEILPVDTGTATCRTSVASLRAGLAATGHGHAVADVAGLQGALDAKASKTSPTFTGPLSQTVTDRFNGYTINGYIDGSMNLAFRAQGARGTAAQPKPVVNGDVVADFIALGHDGTAWRNVGLLRVQVDGAPAGGAVPGALIMMTADKGGGLREVLRCRSDGTVGHNNDSTTVIDAGGHLSLRSYTVATLPTAAPAGRLAHVSNGSTNRRLAVSDGDTWRWPDGSPVS